MTSKVAVIKGERGHEPVFKALDLVDYKSAVSGFEKALIKVNFICEKTWDTGATTDPIVVEAIWKKLKLKIHGLFAQIVLVEKDKDKYESCVMDVKKEKWVNNLYEILLHRDLWLLGEPSARGDNARHAN
jgi:hypothetical protein